MKTFLLLGSWLLGSQVRADVSVLSCTRYLPPTGKAALELNMPSEMHAGWDDNYAFNRTLPEIPLICVNGEILRTYTSADFQAITNKATQTLERAEKVATEKNLLQVSSNQSRFDDTDSLSATLRAEQEILLKQQLVAIKELPLAHLKKQIEESLIPAASKQIVDRIWPRLQAELKKKKGS